MDNFKNNIFKCIRWNKINIEEEKNIQPKIEFAKEIYIG